MARERMTKPCAHCGKRFSAAHRGSDPMHIKQTKYCSRLCRRRAIKAWRKAPERGEIVNGEFRPTYRREVEKGELKIAGGFGPRPHEPPVPKTECAECGKPVKWKGGRPAIYCTTRCRVKAFRRKAQEKANAEKYGATA